jgi:hypothetical protein
VGIQYLRVRVDRYCIMIYAKNGMSQVLDL